MNRALRLAWRLSRITLMVCGALSLLLFVLLWRATAEHSGPPRPPPESHPAPPGTAMGEAPPREAVVKIFEQTFASKDLDALLGQYHPDAVMHDTWRRCQGAAAIRDYYAQQFKYADKIHLTVREYLQQGNRVMLRFHGVQRLREPAIDIDLVGVLYLEFRDGKIWYQREYWDGMAFLDGVPVLGRLFRSLRQWVGGE